MEQIAAADNPFQLALRYAAAGNLIDFGSKNTFTQDDVTALLDRVPDITFALDDSAELLEQIRSAQNIMYLGDNCGEIVLDKILIEQILQENPNVQVTFGVRGGPIINDVTVEDAQQVGMDRVARVLPSGVAFRPPLLKTVLKSSSAPSTMLTLLSVRAWVTLRRLATAVVAAMCSSFL